MVLHTVRMWISMMVFPTVRLIKKHGILLLLILIVILLAANLFLLLPRSPMSQLPQLSLLTTRRQRTILIINNERICTSNPPVLVHSSSRLIASTIPTNQRSLLIVIISARDHFMQRNLVRQTYGTIRNINNINILAIVFMLAMAPENDKVKAEALESESNKFGDIIMGDFIDTYRNLTRKTIMAYEWVTSFCQDAHFVVKTDDDTVLNIFKLTEELNALSPDEVTSSTIRCPVHYNEGVITNKKSQFYASPVDFPLGIFPPHCNGNFYVSTMTVIKRLADEISRSFLGRFTTHEDVFMTGIVVAKINAEINSSSIFTWQKNEPIGLINKRSEWETYALQSQKGDDAEYLIKLLRRPINETENFDEFLKRFGTKVYFLLAHNKEFEERYTRLWQVIVKIFQKLNDEW